MPGAPARREPQPHVLREYALLADGERGALIGPRGDIVWMCAPRWDSDAVFSALVGGTGAYSVTPADPAFVWGGYYEEGTLIWRSRWMTPAGAIECREALAYPADPHTAILLRRVVAADRPAELRVALDPRAAFGRMPLRERHLEAGVWSGRAGGLYVRWSGAERAWRSGEGLALNLSVAPGAEHDLVLEISDRPFAEEPAAADRLWSATENRWRRTVPAMTGSLTPRDARHAYAVLCGLTSASGGMVAAATTSLPERSEAGRNYDYRFSWIRDQSYAGQAVAASGEYPLLDHAVDFLAERMLADGPGLLPAYTVDGGAVPGEQKLAALRGYPGGRTFVGNGIDNQFQLDAFGEVLLLLAAGARYDRLEAKHWRAAETAVAAIAQRWTEPGAGVWELDPEHWAHSRLICAAGLRQIAAAGAPRGQASEWTSLADAIIVETTKDCLHPTGRWQRSPVGPVSVPG